MRTRSRFRSRNNSARREASPAIVEPLRIEFPFLEDQFQEDPPPEVLMADNRTTAELLQAPTEGYEDAIIILETTTNNFELKHGLINLVQNNQFFGHDKEDPHAHIRYFNKITSTMRVPNVPSTNSSTPAISSDVAELKDMVKALLLDKKNQSPAPTPSTTPVPVKANQCQNIQNQYQNLQIQMATLTDMMFKFVSANTASSSGSGTLP
nr:reverse transcriptase domain-containing protein [Tanacetum cinerariifolium]